MECMNCMNLKLMTHKVAVKWGLLIACLWKCWYDPLNWSQNQEMQIPRKSQRILQLVHDEFLALGKVIQKSVCIQPRERPLRIAQTSIHYDFE